MHRRLGGYVVEGQHILILIDPVTGNFPGEDFAKNTIAHIPLYSHVPIHFHRHKKLYQIRYEMSKFRLLFIFGP
jgi:hypothetical protein